MEEESLGKKSNAAYCCVIDVMLILQRIYESRRCGW